MKRRILHHDSSIFLLQHFHVVLLFVRNDQNHFGWRMKNDAMVKHGRLIRYLQCIGMQIDDVVGRDVQCVQTGKIRGRRAKERTGGKVLKGEIWMIQIRYSIIDLTKLIVVNVVTWKLFPWNVIRLSPLKRKLFVVNVMNCCESRPTTFCHSSAYWIGKKVQLFEPNLWRVSSPNPDSHLQNCEWISLVITAKWCENVRVDELCIDAWNLQSEESILEFLP